MNPSLEVRDANSVTMVRDDDSGPDTDAVVEFQAVPGVPYYISVATQACDINPCSPGGEFLLRWRPVPTNDSFNGPQAITGLTGSVAGDNRGATTEPGEPVDSHHDGGGTSDYRSGTLWYTWIPSASGIAQFDFLWAGAESIGLPLVRAYVGDSLPTLIEQRSTGCTSFLPGPPDFECDERTRFAVSAGTTYRIVVAAVSDCWFYVSQCILDLGTFTLGWAFEPRPNDMFGQATSISSASGSIAGTTELATSEVGEPRPGDSAATASDQYSSVWFKWVAPSSAPTAFVVQTFPWICLDPGYQPYDGIAAYTGSSLTNLVTVAQGGSDARGAVFATQAGQTYYIQVGALKCGHPITLSWGSAKPAAPANFSGTVSEGQAHLTWTASPFSTSYNVYRGVALNELSLLATVTTTGYDDTSILDGTAYLYQVSGVNEWGEGLRSVTIQVPAGVPLAPESLTAASLGTSGIKLTWSAPFDGGSPITGYQIYRSTTASGSGAFLAAVGAVATYTDLSLVDLTRYYYRVSAVNALGQSPLSLEASAIAQLTAPAPPEIVSPVEGSLNPYTVAISGTSEAGSAVKVYADAALLGTATANNSGNWTLSKSLGSQRYSIHAIAYNAAGNASPASAVRTFQVDGISPTITINNAYGSAVSSFTPLAGSALDAGEVVQVTISFQDPTGKSLGEFATCTCPGTSITWSHYPAVAPGTYLVQVFARDRAGNVGQSGSIRIVKI